MSRLRADDVLNQAGTGAVNASEGLTIPSGKKLTVSGARTIASATATGTEGEICWDADYIYICVGTDTWKRVAIATW